MRKEDFCPIRDILDKTADKWSLLVLYPLRQQEVMRFNELQKAIPDISQKMLTQTLRRLEQMSLISREAYPEVPPRVEYRLTVLGHSFMDNIEPLVVWAIENRDSCLR
jgi:DNA-binding HxlR family transcriptional regulator